MIDLILISIIEAGCSQASRGSLLTPPPNAQWSSKKNIFKSGGMGGGVGGGGGRG